MTKKLLPILLIIFFFQNTTNALEFPFTLRYGFSGDFVKNLQGFINNVTGSSLKTDGIFGNQTRNQVKEFQKSNGLAADGVVGKDTIAKIKEINDAKTAADSKESQQAEAPKQSDSASGGGGEGSQESGDGPKGSEQSPSSDSSGSSATPISSQSGTEALDQSKSDTKTTEALKDVINGTDKTKSGTGSESCGGVRLVCTGTGSIFNHADSKQKCKRDKNDQQNGGKSASGVKLGEVGKPGIPAVALPPIVRQQKGVSFGTAVEVLNIGSGVCKSFPLLDSGPGKGPLSAGVVIDLTGSAFDALNGGAGCPKIPQDIGNFSGGMKVKYYVDVTGKKLSPGQIGGCSSLK